MEMHYMVSQGVERIDMLFFSMLQHNRIIFLPSLYIHNYLFWFYCAVWILFMLLLGEKNLCDWKKKWKNIFIFLMFLAHTCSILLTLITLICNSSGISVLNLSFIAQTGKHYFWEITCALKSLPSCWEDR